MGVLASSGVLAPLLLAAVCASLCTTISSPRKQHCLRLRGVALVPSSSLESDWTRSGDLVEPARGGRDDRGPREAGDDPASLDAEDR